MDLMILVHLAEAVYPATGYFDAEHITKGDLWQSGSLCHRHKCHHHFQRIALLMEHLLQHLSLETLSSNNSYMRYKSCTASCPWICRKWKVVAAVFRDQKIDSGFYNDIFLTSEILLHIPLVVFPGANPHFGPKRDVIDNIRELSLVQNFRNERKGLVHPEGADTPFNWIPRRNWSFRFQTFPLSQGGANFVNRKSLLLQSDDIVRCQ